MRNATLGVACRRRRRRIARASSRPVAGSRRCSSSSTSATSATCTRRRRAARPFRVQFRGVASRASRTAARRARAALPQSSTTSAADTSAPSHRSPHARRRRVVLCGSAYRGDNRRENHRVRLALRGDVADRERLGGCGVRSGATRANRASSDAEAAIERPPPTAPLHRYVSLFNEQAGSRCSATGSPSTRRARWRGARHARARRRRAVAQRSAERPGHAGWPTPTPGAQCLGPFDGEFAVMLHGPRTDETIDAIERAADDVLNPLVGTTLRSALERSSRRVDGVRAGRRRPRVLGDQGERGRRVARAALREPAASDEVEGAWRLPFDLRRGASRAARRNSCRRRGRRRGREVSFTASPRAIVTRSRSLASTDSYARSRSVDPASPASRSRSASPSSVHASTVATSARPGAIATHGAATIRSRPPAIMFPQLGCGG